MVGSHKWRCSAIRAFTGVSRKTVTSIAVVIFIIVVIVLTGAYLAEGKTPAPEAATAVSATPKDTVVSLGQNETSCGMKFFSKKQLTLMRKQFGSISCIGLISTHQWIVVGDGMQTNSPATPPPPTRGGAIVALETCPTGNTSCKNAIAKHNFDNFTVSYPPNPSPGRMDLQIIDASTILNVTDGSCGSFSFDLKNMKWYVTQPGVDSALIDGNQTTKPVQTPLSRSGTIAIASAAPTADMGSCQPALS